jgi:hypothetical protein
LHWHSIPPRAVVHQQNCTHQKDYRLCDYRVHTSFHVDLKAVQIRVEFVGSNCFDDSYDKNAADDVIQRNIADCLVIRDGAAAGQFPVSVRFLSLDSVFAEDGGDIANDVELFGLLLQGAIKSIFKSKLLELLSKHFSFSLLLFLLLLFHLLINVFQNLSCLGSWSRLHEGLHLSTYIVLYAVTWY